MSPAPDILVTAFVLAGGQSSRMGTNKAFLRWGDGTLLSHSLKLLTAVAIPVRIVGSIDKFAEYRPTVQDVYPGQGPLAGIHAALMSSATDLNLMLAVDMPLVELAFLQYLIQKASRSDAFVTASRIGGRFQPLCAIYRKPFAQVAEKALREGNNKIDALFSTIMVNIIEQSDLETHGFSPDMFRNLNTPSDWEQAKSLSSKSS